jgi:hypothetical protein
MKKIIVVFLTLVCIFSIFCAGCTSSASDSSAAPTPSSTLPQPKYSSGDVIGKGDSSTTVAIAVDSFDSGHDTYNIYDVVKTSDGTWQASSNSVQRSLSRSSVEKLYPKKLGGVSGTSTYKSAQSTPTSVIANPSVQNTIPITQSQSSSLSSGYQIRVTYGGTWSGAYYNDGSSVSVDGTGSKTITLPNSNGVVSGSFQKKDGSSNELKVEILNNGNVLKSGTTTAAYGVVAIASTPYDSTLSTVSGSSSKTVQITVNYNGQWTGAYGEVGAMTSVDGTGSKTYTITSPNYMVSATFQKKDGSASELSVQISEDGSVLKSGSTTAAYGLVLVSTKV